MRYGRGDVLSSPFSLCVLWATMWACKASGHAAAMSWSIFTSGLTISPPMCSRLAMPRTGSVSARRSTRADCASSTPASATPAATGPRASRSHPWRPCVSAPMEDKVYCVRSVSVAAPHGSMRRRFGSFIKRLICKQLVNESLKRLVEWEPVVK